MRLETAEQLIRVVRVEAIKYPGADVEKLLEAYPENILAETQWERLWKIIESKTYTDPLSGNKLFY